MAATRAMRVLCDGLVDYAGLFPPAGLGMQETVERYARYMMGEHAWMLGRLICPASRLEELSACGAALMPGTHATSGYREHADIAEAWPISVVADMDGPRCLEAMSAFDDRHASEEGGRARIVSLELRVHGTDDIDAVMEELPDDIQPFFEVPAGSDPRGIIAALAGEDGAAKIRCGGVEPGMIPPGPEVARFVASCARAGVAFKATAGLHHPLRAEHPLTYADDAPRGLMHGFVNVFLGAALFLARQVDEAGLVELLEERDPDAFAFTDTDAGWREARVDAVGIARAREALALSYGSCSFEEPVADLQRLGWL